MIEFKRNNYFAGYWFIAGDGVDWLAAVWREAGAKDWVLRYRFRYHNDEPPKGHEEFVVQGATEDDIVTDINDLAAHIASDYGGEVRFVPVHGHGGDALAVFAVQPWVRAWRVGGQVRFLARGGPQ